MPRFKQNEQVNCNLSTLHHPSCTISLHIQSISFSWPYMRKIQPIAVSDEYWSRPTKLKLLSPLSNEKWSTWLASSHSDHTSTPFTLYTCPSVLIQLDTTICPTYKLRSLSFLVQGTMQSICHTSAILSLLKTG